ncbi:MAG: hydroxypyruvate isomerase [Rhodoplanes sp.]|uniref:hydroxypyruvate isomerase n=1 Tax=Rhodoplanes sp. TaxID=1968906 RepID=UPI0017AB82AF|nr:hydroxypyruvate isomerase [Rhodoplanes sp.]NVO15139.1 hydroxypyruvate isomerase [Rhodoplanes sp.]
MPRFSANLSMLFTELPFLDRFAAAASAGFEAVEYMFPYDYTPDQLAAALRRNHLSQILFNLPAGDWARGERGIAGHPDRVAEFRNGVRAAATFAHALECPRVNCLVGFPPVGVAAETAHRTLVDNLRHAAEALQGDGVLLLVEPINRFDMAGFQLSGSADALALIDEVGSDNLKLQYDIYHMQRSEGELSSTIEKNIDRIGHIQVADNPGRGEPGTGEINFDFLFRLLDRIGYDGWVGCEYKPKNSTLEGLTWLRGRASDLRPAIRDDARLQ